LEVGVTSLLEVDIEKLLMGIERKCSVKLPRRVIEVYLDVDHDMLFIRFKEPDKTEVGEPLETKAIATLFTEEGTDEITALEIIGVSELLKELSY
jgi:imidazole glycerol phosphate synthase subunit HisF